MAADIVALPCSLGRFWARGGGGNALFPDWQKPARGPIYRLSPFPLQPHGIWCIPNIDKTPRRKHPHMADGMTAEQALGWSRDQRFTSVYLDDEQDPFLQMDMNIDGGVSEANFTDNLEIWRSSLSAFKDYIDW